MVQSCSIERAVDDVLARLPSHIHLGLPLGLGKANRFVNALYQRIRQLPERRLTIYTALSLGRPPLGEGRDADAASISAALRLVRRGVLLWLIVAAAAQLAWRLAHA